jgi:hypothetical protein
MIDEHGCVEIRIIERSDQVRRRVDVPWLENAIIAIRRSPKA